MGERDKSPWLAYALAIATAMALILLAVWLASRWAS